MIQFRLRRELVAPGRWSVTTSGHARPLVTRGRWTAEFGGGVLGREYWAGSIVPDARARPDVLALN